MWCNGSTRPLGGWKEVRVLHFRLSLIQGEGQMSTFKMVTIFFVIIIAFLILITPSKQAEETPPPIIIADPLIESTLPSCDDIKPEDGDILEETPIPEPPSEEVKEDEEIDVEEKGEEVEVEEFIPDPPCEVTGEFKSWTPYTIYSRYSKQYKLQQIAYTDDNGLRKVGEYFCVALGSYYGREIGLVYEITLRHNGEYKTFKAVLCDQKDDRDTDSTHRYTKSCKCMVEFAIDKKVAQKANRIVYHGTVSALEEFRGSVVKIKNIGKMDIATGEVALY